MMLNEKRVRKVEKEVTKRLKKFYRKEAYFCIDKIEFHYDFDASHIMYIHGRAGYPLNPEDENSKYEQINIKFDIDGEIIKTIGEYAALIYYAVIQCFDGFEFFNKE